jgi:hypothetical protein
MITKNESSYLQNKPEATIFKIKKEPVEKWQRRLNRVKLRVNRIENISYFKI